MGLTAKCLITIDGKTSQGTAHLESVDLRLDASSKATIPFEDILNATARAGALTVRHRSGEAILNLGKAAETWALKIRYPRGRTEKLGVKAGSRVALRGLKDPVFLSELKAAGAKVASRFGAGPYDVVIVRLSASVDLPLLADARKRIVSNGMVWAVWPKGRKEFREDDIRCFGPMAGLVDVKVMSFSDELSGLKLVIPKALR
jgi:hypothetical protein